MLCNSSVCLFMPLAGILILLNDCAAKLGIVEAGTCTGPFLERYRGAKHRYVIGDPTD